MKKQHTTKRKKKQHRKTKHNQMRGGALFHGSVDEFLELARSQHTKPLEFFLYNYANQTDDTFLYNLVKHLLRNNQINEIQVVVAVGVLINYGIKFYRSIRLLLNSLKPIQDVLLLNKLYEDVFNRLNDIKTKNTKETKETIFKTIRNAGHVPLTEDHKHSIYWSHGYGRPEHNNIFKKIVPAAKTETANTIYSLGRREIELPPDNIMELYSYLDAAADDSFNKQMRKYDEEMDAEEAAELENVEDGDY